MLVFRPITPDDLPQLAELAAVAGIGLTTLPKDPQLLENRIAESRRSFERLAMSAKAAEKAGALGGAERPGGEVYLFVLEDLHTGKIVGTSAIVSKVGGFEPFYAYKIETTVAESDVLNVRKEIKFLKLVTDHNGPCEVGSLFLNPEYRKEGNGRFLSLARFLFIAERPRRFETTVIAEMRGLMDASGRSPFWECLGRVFFDTDFPNADYLSMVNKKFIADLMPAHPIYIPLLPREAQEAIGQVQEQTRPAVKILEEEGFKVSGMVDIFDAGPILSAKRDAVRAVKESAKAPIVEITEKAIEGEVYMVGTARPEFRAAKGNLEVVEKGVRVNSALALALGARVGDMVRYATLRAKKKEATT
jgi:arginine N-succinyltransferase